MHKALHSKYNIDRLYVTRKEGGREFPCIEDSANGSIRGLLDYIKKSKERLVTATRNGKDKRIIFSKQ